MTIFFILLFIFGVYLMWWGGVRIVGQYKNRNKGYRPCGLPCYRSRF